MLKVSKYILFVGIALGTLVGGIAVYAALDHNPHNEFTDSPWKLIPIFMSWLVVFFAPFGILTGIIESLNLLKRNKHKS